MVVGENGTLLAWAHGISPSWIKDAVRPEVWAFYIALQLSLSPPRIVTECKNITDSLLAEVHEACEANVLGQDLEDGCNQTIWMPLLEFLASVGSVQLRAHFPAPLAGEQVS